MIKEGTLKGSGSHTEANAGLIALVLASEDGFSQATVSGETLPIIVASLASVPGTANVTVVVDETDISSPVAVYIRNPDVCCCKVSARRNDHANVLELTAEMSLISSGSHLLEEGSRISKQLTYRWRTCSLVERDCYLCV